VGSVIVHRQKPKKHFAMALLRVLCETSVAVSPSFFLVKPQAVSQTKSKYSHLPSHPKAINQSLVPR